MSKEIKTPVNGYTDEQKETSSYYFKWLKLSSSFYDSGIVKLLRRTNPDYPNVMLQMILKGMSYDTLYDESGNDKKVSVYRYKVPYLTGQFYLDLSIALDIEEDHCKNALTTMLTYHLLSIDECNYIVELFPLDDMCSVGVETKAASRMRKSRASKSVSDVPFAEILYDEDYDSDEVPH